VILDVRYAVESAAEPTKSKAAALGWPGVGDAVPNPQLASKGINTMYDVLLLTFLDLPSAPVSPEGEARSLSRRCVWLSMSVASF
jgi:hypothetical protein